MMAGTKTLTLLALLGTAFAQYDPHFTGNRTTIVHLFEWKWNDIAEECERMLGPYGYGGVQTSPPSENAVITSPNRPWYERYQPVSYKLETRSGTEEEFKSMVRRCNNAGVRVYADVVLNHMTGYLGKGVGTGGTTFDSGALSYPGVPYSSFDFNVQGQCTSQTGDIQSLAYSNDAKQVRNCRLNGLNDLNQGSEYVRGKMVEYLNRLLSYGVAGFRVDGSKHMWPDHLKSIFDQVNNLAMEHGFPYNARPFIYMEVIDNGGEAVSSLEYVGIGRVTEFKVCANIGDVFLKNNQKLSYLKNWGPEWSFLADDKALVFISNHDNQRGHGAGGSNILTFREAKPYKLAQAFSLAWPYGVTRVMSSYNWDQKIVNGEDENNWVGPPHDENMNTLPVTIKNDFTCGNGWVCEHRWRPIYNMVRFRSAVQGTPVNNWWDNGKDQIAFSRGDKGFVAINNDDVPLQATIQTGLPAGQYCDVISGYLESGHCTGKVINVDNNGKVSLYINNYDEDPIVAINVNAKL